MLSGTADRNTITIHEIKQTRRGVFVDHTDTARPDHIGQRAWRGVVALGDAYVWLGVYAGQGDPVAGRDGADLIGDFAAEIRRLNTL